MQFQKKNNLQTKATINADKFRNLVFKAIRLIKNNINKLFKHIVLSSWQDFVHVCPWWS